MINNKMKTKSVVKQECMKAITMKDVNQVRVQSKKR